MKRIFKCGRLDRRGRYITIISLCVFTVVIALFFLLGSSGGYLTAWIATLIVAVIVLFIFSVPVSIEVGFGAMEIKCLVELTYIHIGDIAEVKVLPGKDVKHLLPILGSYGFFGYFGFYLDPSTWTVCRMYCKNLDAPILITTTYEKRYIVSCVEADRFMELIEDAKHYRSIR